MKKFLLLIVFGVTLQLSHSQTYVAFPTDTASWNCLFWWNGSPNPADQWVQNYNFKMNGDTILKGNSYKKIYYNFNGSHYCGGLREDNLKQIFFFPFSTNFSIGATSYTFPNDTCEQLLYTFNNLIDGQILPINTGSTTIQVGSSDSILIGTKYHKRYEIYSSNLTYDYWIEGIGSTKNLLSSYTYEFEWFLYTLCYEDSITHFISSPNGEDSCHYTLTTGINDEELLSNYLSIYPNPTTENLTLEIPQKAVIEILNIEGQIIKLVSDADTQTTIDLKNFSRGVYVIKAKTDKGIVTKKFIKE